jgi:hypothetical protein
LDLEAIASDGHSTGDHGEQDSDRASLYSTSDLGVDGMVLTRINLPMIALRYGRELISFSSGILDVGYVYF